MRDLVSCFSEKTIKVSDYSSCSSSSSSAHVSHSTHQNSLSCLYQTSLSPQKHFIIAVTWCKNYMGGRGLSIDVHDRPSLSQSSHTSSSPFWNSKGSQSFQFNDSNITTHWDFSSAHFKAGSLEPASRFHVTVIIDSRIGLLLGDMDEEEALDKFKASTPISRFFLVARKQYLLGADVYSTKACFSEGEAHHDVVIEYRGGGGVKEPELLVSIDRKKVVHVKRLQWKFRGNAMVSMGGSPVEIIWDVHGWLFNPESGQGIFVFRRRSGDERLVMKEEEIRAGFSTLIYARKIS